MELKTKKYKIEASDIDARVVVTERSVTGSN